MINPPPRPALRKAPDSDVHPVAVTAPARVPTELRPVVGIGGRTSDTLVSRPAKKVKRSTLEVKLPKPLLKAARQAAKTRKEDLQDVVETALREYVAR
ncbi:MAG: hypothetical protein U0R28_07310 [Candidatus Nanopelagicales bacterium]